MQKNSSLIKKFLFLFYTEWKIFFTGNVRELENEVEKTLRIIW